MSPEKITMQSNPLPAETHGTGQLPPSQSTSRGDARNDLQARITDDSGRETPDQRGLRIAMQYPPGGAAVNWEPYILGPKLPVDSFHRETTFERVEGEVSKAFGVLLTPLLLATLPELLGPSVGAPMSVPTNALVSTEFDVHPRVLEQLADPRLGPLKGTITPEKLQELANNPNALRFLDNGTGNTNIVQLVDGRLVRITTAGDAPTKIISVGPIQRSGVFNGVANGRFDPIVQ